MRTVKIYKGWKIRRNTRRHRTLDERDSVDTYFTVFPVDAKPGRTYPSSRFPNPREAMEWIDARELGE